jgi:uncharacterized protein (UPF0335 family)
MSDKLEELERVKQELQQSIKRIMEQRSESGLVEILKLFDGELKALNETVREVFLHTLEILMEKKAAEWASK